MQGLRALSKGGGLVNKISDEARLRRLNGFLPAGIGAFALLDTWRADTCVRESGVACPLRCPSSLSADTQELTELDKTWKPTMEYSIDHVLPTGIPVRSREDSASFCCVTPCARFRLRLPYHAHGSRACASGAALTAAAAAVCASGSQKPASGPGCGCGEGGCRDANKCSCAAHYPFRMFAYVKHNQAKGQPRLVSALPCIYECGDVRSPASSPPRTSFLSLPAAVGLPPLR